MSLNERIKELEISNPNFISLAEKIVVLVAEEFELPYLCLVSVSQGQPSLFLGEYQRAKDAICNSAHRQDSLKAVIETNRPIIKNHSVHSVEEAKDTGKAGAEMAVPVKCNNRLVAILYASSAKPFTFEEYSQSAMVLIAMILSGIFNKRLSNILQDITQVHIEVLAECLFEWLVFRSEGRTQWQSPLLSWGMQSQEIDSVIELAFEKMTTSRGLQPEVAFLQCFLLQSTSDELSVHVQSHYLDLEPSIKATLCVLAEEFKNYVESPVQFAEEQLNIG